MMSLRALALVLLGMRTIFLNLILLTIHTLLLM